LGLHVLQAQSNINQAQDAAADSLTIESTTADKGYLWVAEIKQLQAEGIRTVISDPIKNQKLENLDKDGAQVVRKAKRSAGSKSGKVLLRRIACSTSHLGPRSAHEAWYRSRSIVPIKPLASQSANPGRGKPANGAPGPLIASIY
jgi:hypothetical protein